MISTPTVTFAVGRVVFSLSFFSLMLTDPCGQVAFESIYVSGPEPTELSQPGIHLLKRFWVQPVETALCVDHGLHETGLAQDAQMLGHHRLRHTKLTLDLSHRLLGRD
jgi:hypothetical protein